VIAAWQNDGAVAVASWRAGEPLQGARVVGPTGSCDFPLLDSNPAGFAVVFWLEECGAGSSGSPVAVERFPGEPFGETHVLAPPAELSGAWPAVAVGENAKASVFWATLGDRDNAFRGADFRAP
jgi:hypothetical protein